MAINAKQWALNSYTNATWTDLVDAAVETLVKNVVVSVGANLVNVSVRVVDDSGVLISMIVPGEDLDTNRGYKLDLDLIVLEATQRLQVRASAAGVNFSANGMERT